MRDETRDSVGLALHILAINSVGFMKITIHSEKDELTVQQILASLFIAFPSNFTKNDPKSLLSWL